MSITNTNGHTSKRRKLSHSSDDGASGGAIVRKSIKAPKSSDVDGKSSGAVHSIQSRTPSLLATGGMTKSSILQLQVDELVAEVQPNYEGHLKDLKPLSERLIQAIKSIPNRAPVSLSEAERTLRKKHNIAVPFGAYRPEPDVKYKFEYQQPERCVLRGGLVHRMSTKTDICLEVAVQMPTALFQEKDYLNHRALHKRAYYLACIAAGLQKDFAEELNLHYELQNGNDLVPVIVIKYANAHASKTTQQTNILINVVFSDGLGPIEKMLPTRNCVRSDNKSSEEGAQSTPTPSYNSTVRSLASTQYLDQLLETTIRKCDAFRDVCSLGQTWLKQRGLGSEVSAGGFGLSEWAYACAILLSGGGHKGHPLFSDRYSSVQLFKAMLQVLATRDLTDPLLVRAADMHIAQGEMPVLFDGLSGVNILSNMSRWSYDMLRHHAQTSLTAVNARTQNNFESTFITKVGEPGLQYDEIYTINLSSKSENIQSLTTKVHNTLKRGLGDRVSLLSLRESVKKSWKIDSSAAKQTKSSQVIEVCLLANPEAALRSIDHGPTAEQQEEAKEFRKFWGEKSELRRFRDGSITETLVWSSAQSVTLQIVTYLMAYHFRILPSSIECKTPDLQSECLFSNAPIDAIDAFKIISNKFQELSSKLHQMEGLPLPIRAVSPAGSALRSASIGHPLDPITSSPIDIVIQFDSSARWPDHLLAIQHTKVAFLAKISDLIVESDSSLTTRIGLEDADTSNTGYFNTSFLDIISPSPAPGLSAIVFRLRIYHERELQLLQTKLADKSITPPTRDSLATALAAHKCMFQASVTHTASLRNLITHFQPLSTTIRLLKFWVASHNLSNHVPEPILEIIAAHVFLHPYPWSTPGNGTTAFLRCLHFLSHWDWAASPLIVDLSLSQDMTSAQLTELETRFQAWRKLDPNMNTVAWFVGTSADNTGTIWTQNAKPARVVAGRLTALAGAALDLVKSKGTTMQDEDWKTLFVSPVSDFDFVIHLRASVVRGGKKSARGKNGEVKFKNLQVQEDLDVDSIGHDVVSLYLRDLEKAFTNTVLFFHGERGRSIAGLWRPSVTGRKDWRVRLGYSTVPFAGTKDDDGQVKGSSELNKEGILAEIAQLGEGMIEKIAVRE